MAVWVGAAEEGIWQCRFDHGMDRFIPADGFGCGILQPALGFQQGCTVAVEARAFGTSPAKLAEFAA